MACLVGFEGSSSRVVFYVTGKAFPPHHTNLDVDYEMDPITCPDSNANPYIWFYSGSSGFVDVDYGDGTKAQYPLVKMRNDTRYSVIFRGYNAEHQKNPDSHPWWFYHENGQEYVPIPPHIYEDGQIAERVVTLRFSNDITHLVMRRIRFTSFPILDAPSLTQFNGDWIKMDVFEIPFDRIGRSENITYFTLQGLDTSKITPMTDWPEGLLKLKKIQYLGMHNLFNFHDYESSNLRRVVEWQEMTGNNLNWCDIPYIKEFNEMPNLKELSIISNRDDWPIFEVDHINQNLTKLSFLGDCASWKNELVSGKGLENLQSFYGYSAYRCPMDALPDYWKEMRALTSMDMGGVFKTQTIADTFVNSFYDYVTGWDHITMSSTAKDGKRNQFYGLSLSCYDAANAPNCLRPSGVMRAPSGFAQGSSNGTPTTPMEKIYVLTNNYAQKWTLRPE